MNVTAWRDVSHAEPGLLRAAVLALLVHLVFFAFMVFGLSWKNEPAETMVVDLWSDLPQPVKPIPVAKQTAPKPEVARVEAPPPPKKTATEIKEKTVKPQPVKEMTKQPEPVKETPSSPEPIKVESPPPPKKPTIEIKEKTIKPQPVKEATKQPEPVKETPPNPKLEPIKEKVAKPEVTKETTKKPDLEKEKLLKEQQQAEEIKQQQQREREAIAQKAAAEKTKQMDEVAKYKAMIQAKIRSRIVMPPDLPGNPVVDFRVTLLPGGEVLNVMLRRSSGYSAFDEAVERAIFLSTPLPIPPDPALFREFRDFNLTVHYRDSL
ncbi:cell envelope integrity protein TolA [Nitrosomonas sp. Nm58]|uniref:cell envelope integrity protein TolA n=1 Tax=Nitrosomonas sp. Nm58 TaxID=200126 RepID=UPI000894BF91|nr:cell envelope integrity protein TolA [Nitrosomonas sp. Nm58]SDY87708.1 colicin import membrane protein [Nitrosomonas sp. Nm58]